MQTHIISENQLRRIVKQVIAEMAYPASFNMEEFKNCNSFAARVRYCQARLPRISSGSSRIVYKIDDEKVLKLAKNAKGIAQNNAEAHSYAIETGIDAQVFDHDENDLWLEMELARRATAADFKNIIGVPFAFVQNYVNYTAKRYSRNWRNISYDSRYTEMFDRIDDEDFPNWEWFGMLRDYMGDTGLESIGDLQRFSSWGVVKRNGADEIVLVDLGLDDEVYDNFYKRR